MGGGVGDPSSPRSVIAMASIVRGRQGRRQRNTRHKRFSNASNRLQGQVWVATERGTPLLTPPRLPGTASVHLQAPGDVGDKLDLPEDRQLNNVWRDSLELHLKRLVGSGRRDSEAGHGADEGGLRWQRSRGFPGRWRICGSGSCAGRAAGGGPPSVSPPRGGAARAA